MESVNIRFSTPESVQTFVAITRKYLYNIVVRVGRHKVDGKSILGIFSLDFTKPITVEIESDDCQELIKELKPFIERT